MKEEGGAGEGALQAGGIGCVTYYLIRELEGERIERAGGRDADVPKAETAGEILDRGLRAGLDDFRGLWLVMQPAEEACGEAGRSGSMDLRGRY